MVARGRGGGKTPERVVKLLSEDVARFGQNATARGIGLSMYSLHRYLKGVGEPTQATLEKLSDYYCRSVAWLRGDEPDKHTEFLLKFKEDIDRLALHVATREDIPKGEITDLVNTAYELEESIQGLIDKLSESRKKDS